MKLLCRPPPARRCAAEEALPAAAAVLVRVRPCVSTGMRCSPRVPHRRGRRRAPCRRCSLNYARTEKETKGNNANPITRTPPNYSNQKPQEGRASIPVELQYKVSRFHPQILTLDQERKKGKKKNVRGGGAPGERKNWEPREEGVRGVLTPTTLTQKDYSTPRLN